MASKLREKERVGKISITHEGTAYRLRFRYLNKNYSLNIAPYCPDGYKLAMATAAIINSDILFDRFDESLAKYCPRKKAALNHCQEKDNRMASLKDLWQFYKSENKSRIAWSTQQTDWKRVDNALYLVGEKSHLIENANNFFAEVKKLYSVTTVFRLLGQISACCNWAIARRYIQENPYKVFLKELPRKRMANQSKRSRKAFTDKDISEIIKAFYDNPYCLEKDKPKYSHYALFVHFLILTGCRPEEAIALKCSDILKNEQGIFISFNKAYTCKKLNFHTKTYTDRLFPCNGQICELLTVISHNKLPDELLFPSLSGGYIQQSYFSQRIWKPLINALVKHGKVKEFLPPYNLRNTWISSVLRKGIDAATTANWAGTSTIIISKNYQAPNLEVEIPTMAFPVQ